MSGPVSPIPSWPSDMNANTTLDRGLPQGEIIELRIRLDNCQLRNDTGDFFVPNGTLEEILDEATVRDAFRDLPVFRAEPPNATEEYARKVCAQEAPSVKMLALLLLTDMHEAIKPCVDLGINDLALPMPDPRLNQSSNHSASSNIRNEDDKWGSLFDSWPEHCLRNIYITQWCLLAPRFSRQDSIAHYTFTHEQVLPFLRYDDKSSGHSEASDTLISYSSHSQVRRVKIHPAHYDFGDYGVS